MRIASVAGVSAALFIIGITTGGCSNRLLTSDQLVPIAPITASLKCAFAKALLLEAQPGQIQRLKGRVVSGTLMLQIADDTKLGGSLGLSGGPFILTKSASIGVSLSASNEENDTVTTKIAFRYLLNATNAQACQLPQAKGDVYGFSSWLGQVIAGLNIPASVQPNGVIDSINYTGNFAVTKVEGGGINFNVVFVTGSVNDTTTRNDVQNLTFTIAPVSKTNPAPVLGGGDNIGPAFVKRPPPNK